MEFITTVGRFIVEVHRDWSPIGADRFYKLVEDKFYDDCASSAFSPTLWLSSVWRPTRAGMPNGPNDCRTMLLISRTLGGQLRLPHPAPAAGRRSCLSTSLTTASWTARGSLRSVEVIEGMDVVDQISSAHGETPDQDDIRQSGNAYLSRNFPELTYIQTARLVEPAE